MPRTDLLSLHEFSAKEINGLLDLADDVKKNPSKYRNSLERKCLAMLFEKTSTRTRVSFENGMYQLGGNAIYLDWKSTNLHLGGLSDEIKCISSYVDSIMARVYKHETLEQIKQASSVPVINGLSDKYHPCQTLADLMTIREKLDNFKDAKVAWIGDGDNVCNSLIIGCVKLNIPILVASPPNYEPHEEVLRWVKKENNSHCFKLLKEPIEAVEDATVIYTDTFVSMGQEAEKEARLKVFLPKYQVNRELLGHAKKNPYILHCLPAHRGVEITDNVIDSKNSIVFQQAENRMHLQKALLLVLLKKVNI